MKRMIDNGLVSTDNGTVQIGKDLEVGGKIHVNQASDIIDKNGKPIAGGGGAKWVPYSYPACKDSLLIEIEFSDDNQGITSYLTTSYHEYSGYCIPLYGQGGALMGLANVYEDSNNHSYVVYSVIKIGTGGNQNIIDSANQTVTATRMLVNE